MKKFYTELSPIGETRFVVGKGEIQPLSVIANCKNIVLKQESIGVEVEVTEAFKRVDKIIVNGVTFKKESNIVRVDIVDSDTNELQDTFYLEDPDKDKLWELGELLKNRFETGAIEQYSEVLDYINDNFKTVPVDYHIIGW